MPRSPFSGDTQQNGHRNIPILPSSTKPTEINHGEPMDITPPASVAMGPPIHSSPEMDHNGGMTNGTYSDTIHNPNGNGLSAAAATSSQQPKVVQTAFIHKLYNMLEDPAIQNLISWSNNNESFVMSPSTDFSKVLAQYFKHTNISSFVRQLNMYGFHKVSDVFHTGSPESTLWEFKHGNGSFKRGDLAGLREIKRRASRHALIHRDSFTTPHKASISQPGTPAEPVPDVADVRIANLEHNLFELHARLMRTEESNTALSAKCQALNDSLVRCHQWSLDLSHFILNIQPDQESHVRRDITTMQKDVVRHLELVRSFEDPHESLLSGRQPPYFSSMAIDPTPLSPRQPSQDERRPSLHAIPPRPIFKPPQPTQFGGSPRRYGSIGTAPSTAPNGNHSNFQRSLQHPLPQPPPSLPQHPLASVTSNDSPNLARRHTAADIRVPGWTSQSAQPSQTGFASGPPSSVWPSSPRLPSASDQHVRDVLASYQIGVPRQQPQAGPPPQSQSQPQHHHQQPQHHSSFNFSSGSNRTTPPLTNNSSDTTTSTLSADTGWSFGGKFPGSRHLGDSAPQTRRSSMASNVHSLLNPAETVERDEEDGGGGIGEERKRKRVA